MGVVRTESTEIDGITYTTKTFAFSDAANLYAELSNVIPQEVISLIIIPVSGAIEKQRKGKLKDGDSVDLAINVSMQDLATTLESPQILARIIKTVMREASDIPGGISSLMKTILRQTTANPIRIGDFEGAGGKMGDLVTHIDTHFGGDIDSIQEAVKVCVWVLRLNLGKAS